MTYNKNKKMDLADLFCGDGNHNYLQNPYTSDHDVSIQGEHCIIPIPLSYSQILKTTESEINKLHIVIYSELQRTK